MRTVQIPTIETELKFRINKRQFMLVSMMIFSNRFNVDAVLIEVDLKLAMTFAMFLL